jgi:tetratricopeptide (TPR) repeat protein
MESAPGLPASSRFYQWSWQAAGWHFTEALAVVAIALGAFLLARGLTGGGSNTPPLVVVDAHYHARLAENIEFFEARVFDTQDSLSYNRLVSLYLERLRLTGNAADIRRAELAAERSLELAPDAYASVVSSARVRLAQHDFEEVLALAARAEDLRPAEPDTLALRGDALMALGRYEEAGEQYRRLLELAPGFAAFTREAIFAETNGNVPLAAQFWNAAIESTREESPIDSAWARVQLGTLYAIDGRPADGERELRTALRVFPGYPLADAGLARVAFMRGDYTEALARYARVTAALPSPEFIAPYAEAALAAGDTATFERQKALLGAVGQLYEANGVRNDLTLILFELDHGDAAAALVKAEAAYRERPSLAAADTYAWALYRAGRLEEAKRYSDEALRLGSKDPLYLSHARAIAEATAAR